MIIGWYKKEKKKEIKKENGMNTGHKSGGRFKNQTKANYTVSYLSIHIVRIVSSMRSLPGLGSRGLTMAFLRSIVMASRVNTLRGDKEEEKEQENGQEQE